jgi:hypothetical protein
MNLRRIAILSVLVLTSTLSPRSTSMDAGPLVLTGSIAGRWA